MAVSRHVANPRVPRHDLAAPRNRAARDGGIATALCHLLVAWMALSMAVPAWAQAPTTLTAQTQRQLLSEPGTDVLGSPAASITVIEYFDYNCPYCKKLAPAFHEVASKDSSVAVVFKEWPIFGGISRYAARAALAAQRQGKYLRAHDALIGAPRLGTTEQVDDALRGAGVDLPRLKSDLSSHGAEIEALLARNEAEARGLGIRGTPGIVVGRRVVASISDSATLTAAIAAAR
jgi:protein-disulfide isomerase